MLGRIHRSLLRLALLATAVLLGAVPFAAGESSSETEGQTPHLDSLVIGFLGNTLGSVTPADTKAATKMWADMIMRRRGAKVDSNAVILGDLVALGQALGDKAVDLVFLLPQDYLEIRDRLPLVPVVLSTPPQGLFDEFVLLARKGDGAEALRGLRGKRLTIEMAQPGALPMLWLQTLLMRETGADDAMRFFSSVKTAHRGSQTVLPVFFQQADACVVTRNAFEAVAELNPQVGRDLAVIASSPGYASSVGCMRRDYFDRVGSLILDNLRLLHEDPQGRQILTLFRKGKLVPFEPAHLASAEELLREHGERARAVAQRP